jgi:hypothetical protein
MQRAVRIQGIQIGGILKYLSAMWVGIQQKQTQTFMERVERKYEDRKMIGVVIRAAYLRPLGHFMYGKVSINGEKVWAGGAEDRTFGFHYVTLEAHEKPPRDMVPALGWCKGGNNYAFNYKGAPHIITKAAVYGMEVAFESVPPENHPDQWEVK